MTPNSARVLERFPSRLPPNYADRVLARLMPSNDLIDKMTPDQARDLAVEIEKLRNDIERNPVKYFKPEPKQLPYMTWDDPEIREHFFLAGNSSGKTTASAIMAAEHALGRALWGKDFREFSLRTPNRGCIFADDFTAHKETTIPHLFTWLPHSELASGNCFGRGPTGAINEIYLKNRSIIYLRTYDQGYDKAEGKDYDWIWNDEPPPRDVYTAQGRGIAKTGGRRWISATLLSQAWLYDEGLRDDVQVFESSSFDNSWNNAKWWKNYAASLTDDEKATRIFGKPSSLSGMIYPGFRDDAPWVVPQVTYPWDVEREEPWPVIMVVDPHERRPLFIIWGYVTPSNGILWFDWAHIPSGAISAVFKDIAKKEASHLAPCSMVVMDPNRGNTPQIDDRSWRQEFEEHDYNVMLGIDDIEFGHSQVREMLFPLDGKPTMQWMENCRGKNGPIYQMQRYVYMEWQRGSRIEKEVRDKPNDKAKDFPDCHRYAACAHFDFRQLMGRESRELLVEGIKVGHSNPYFNR